eukprot:GHVN01104392.1.p1 GENE.GHVN01104392.1~~GHVN01104392.1.p1  ORF type:complete len:167 (+),score=24.49 GHVN01104392.1:439-939(+)
MTEPKEKWEDWTDVDKEYAFKKSLGPKVNETKGAYLETEKGEYLLEVFNLLEYVEKNTKDPIEKVTQIRDEIKYEVLKQLAKRPGDSEHDPFQTLKGKATVGFGSFLADLVEPISQKLRNILGGMNLGQIPGFEARWNRVQSLLTKTKEYYKSRTFTYGGTHCGEQ